MYQLDRTITHPVPDARRCCSTWPCQSQNATGEPGSAPTADSLTTRRTPAATAAPMAPRSFWTWQRLDVSAEAACAGFHKALPRKRAVMPPGESGSARRSEGEHSADQGLPGDGADDAIDGDRRDVLVQGLLEAADGGLGLGPEDPVDLQAFARVAGLVAELELLLDPA